MKRMIAVALVSLAGGCHDDSSDPAARSGCIGSLAGGVVEESGGPCSVCDMREPQRAADGMRESYAGMRVGNGSRGLRAKAPPGLVYPAGRFAGALMLIPPAYAPQTSWTITTYLDGVLRESRTPSNAAGDDPADPTGTDEFYGFTTTLSFDTVEVQLSGGAPGINANQVPEIRFYEFCSDR